MISKTFRRYIWLLDLMLNNPPMTFNKISEEWMSSPLNPEGKELPIRTFHEHRQAIKELFGVNIECGNKGYKYSVTNLGALSDNHLGRWLLKQYSVPQDFVTYYRMRDRILLEEIPVGGSYCNDIIESIQSSKVMEVDYEKFGGHNETLHISPYALKVYDHRWYLLGSIKERDNDIRTIALDRINDIRITDEDFSLPDGFNARKYFADVVGIYNDASLPVVPIKIRAYGDTVNYLRTVPLHKSQSEVYSKFGEYAEFSYRLKITPELITKILALGSEVEVLEPKELRDKVRSNLAKSLSRYNKD